MWYILTTTPGNTPKEKFQNASIWRKIVAGSLCGIMLIVLLTKPEETTISSIAPQEVSSNQTAVERSVDPDETKLATGRTIDEMELEAVTKNYKTLKLTGWFKDDDFVDFLDNTSSYKMHRVTCEVVMNGKDLDGWMKDGALQINLSTPFDFRRIVDGNYISGQAFVMLPKGFVCPPIRSGERGLLTFLCNEGNLKSGNFAERLSRP